MRKYSKQREEIEKVIIGDKTHPTAEEIYARVKARSPLISLGTVYRNLSVLCEEGKIRRIAVPGGADKFDGSNNEHFHAVCSHCGTTFDIDYGTGMLEEAALEAGIRLTSVELAAIGICAECEKKEKAI